MPRRLNSDQLCTQLNLSAELPTSSHRRGPTAHVGQPGETATVPSTALYLEVIGRVPRVPIESMRWLRGCR